MNCFLEGLLSQRPSFDAVSDCFSRHLYITPIDIEEDLCLSTHYITTLYNYYYYRC